MDTRAIIAGTVAVTCVICATISAAVGNDDLAGALTALAGTSVAYAVGLLSEPRANTSSEFSSSEDSDA